MAVIYDETDGQSTQQRHKIMVDTSSDLSDIDVTDIPAGSIAIGADGTVSILDSTKTWQTQ